MAGLPSPNWRRRGSSGRKIQHIQSWLLLRERGTRFQALFIKPNLSLLNSISTEHLAMTSLPKILIITGDVDNIFRDVWTALLQRLKAASDVMFSSDPVSARRLLLAGDISSVLLVSPRPFLSFQEPYRILRDYVRNFAERQGGTVLFCGKFSSFIRPATFELYFANEWKLPWRSGTYVRKTFKINPHFNTNGVNRMASSTFDPATAGLYHQYSQKAPHVKAFQRTSVCTLTRNPTSNRKSPPRL